MARRQPGLVVYDSSLAPSRAFAGAAGTARKLDLATEHRTLFAIVRAGLPRIRTIEGLSRWSDWVALRGELERQGWRLVTEAPAPHGLFRWTMRLR